MTSETELLNAILAGHKFKRKDLRFTFYRTVTGSYGTAIESYLPSGNTLKTEGFLLVSESKESNCLVLSVGALGEASTVRVPLSKLELLDNSEYVQ